MLTTGPSEIVEQAEQMLLIQVLLVIYGYDLSGHRCCSNTDGCSNEWMAVMQSRELSALWDSAFVTRDPWQRGCPSVTIGQSSNTPSQRARGIGSRQKSRGLTGMEVPGTDIEMMPRFKMFCKIICQIFLSWLPLYVEKSLLNLVCDPKESHLH